MVGNDNDKAVAACAVQSEEWLSEAQHDDPHKAGWIFRLVQDGDTPSESDLDLESWEYRRWWKLRN